MKALSLTSLCALLSGCPIARAQDAPTAESCVIDSCEKDICVIETRDKTVHVKKKPEYKEGAVIDCPDHLLGSACNL
jgi:hypothetical protein